MPTAEGESLLIEVGDAEAAEGVEPVSRSGERRGELVAATVGTLEAAAARVAPVVKAVAERFRELDQPSAVEIEFGLKMTVASGVVVASAGGEANFRVVVRWEGREEG
jgi:hypothetical protein